MNAADEVPVAKGIRLTNSVEWASDRLDEVMAVVCAASPIESALEEAIADAALDREWFVWRCIEHREDVRRGLEIPSCECAVFRRPSQGDRAPESWHLMVCRQATEATYRVDLLIRLWQGSAKTGAQAVLAVECDGHNSHERTKQQAAYDRARDRELLIHRGLITVRFTGSEIHHAAERCAKEALDALLAIVTTPAREPAKP